MPLPKAISATPTEIADISVELADFVAGPDPTEEPAHQEARYSVQVRYSNDEIKVLTGDLIPHLGSADKTWLVSFMVKMRTKATAEMLP